METKSHDLVANAEPCEDLAPDLIPDLVAKEVAAVLTEIVQSATNDVCSTMIEEVHDLIVSSTVETINKGECDQAVVNAEPCKAGCKDLVNADLENPDLVVKEEALPGGRIEIVLPATNNNVYLTIEDCTQEFGLHPQLHPELHPLAANGGGDGAKDENGSNTCVVSQAGSTVTMPAAEEITDRISSIFGPPSEILPAADEPSWGDVADEPIVTPPSVKQPRLAPENEEVDDVVRTMRSILMNLRNEDDARLSPEDEAEVRSLLEYHPKAEEKMGSGVDYIKIKRHSTFQDVRCFWVVRTDGSETDFSYHKCLKEKVAKEHPSFVSRYDAVYRVPKRPRHA